jgi:DnaJ domain
MGAADLTNWRRQNSDPLTLVITLTDGRRLRGNMLVPRDKSLTDLFNMPMPFIEFEDFDQGQVVLAKTSIVSLRPHRLPAADQLDKKISALDKSDPYRVLGLGKSAAREDIRAAYLALARLYHPDRFASTELPPEVAEYIDAMARRINIAYADIAPPAASES